MISWIKDTYDLSIADLSRMFQTSSSTGTKWLATGRASAKSINKITMSYNYLSNTFVPSKSTRNN